MFHRSWRRRVHPVHQSQGRRQDRGQDGWKLDRALERRGTAEGVTPKPTIVFNTGNNTVSGFDGCNNFKGSYTFVDGKLKAKVSGTRMACPNEAARGVSGQMANLFANGAEVVETSFMAGHVLLLKNSSAELRLGPSDQVK
jgi:heat shock protein HslJ